MISNYLDDSAATRICMNLLYSIYVQPHYFHLRFLKHINNNRRIHKVNFTIGIQKF